MLNAKYYKIQFIGFAISTTPGDLRSIEEMSDDGRYLGVENVENDIHARLELLWQAIEQAYENRETGENILKVFCVPEFFFRGNKGAYYGTPETFFQKYFHEFISAISQEKYKDWLFVLGTLVTSDMTVVQEKEPTKSLFPIGDALLNIYDRLHPLEDNTLKFGKNRHSVKSFLKSLDGNMDSEDKNCLLSALSSDPSYVSVLAATLNYCDEKAEILVDNRCLIVEGGKKSPRIIENLKKNKSKEDFILNGIDQNYIQSITRYPKIPEISEQKQADNDAYCLFNYEGIRFGVEICLDHSRQRLMHHLEKHPADTVDVQLVISCGMDIRPSSVIAATGGLVFNCDGEYVLEGFAENGEHCHTMLKVVEKGAEEVIPAVLSDYIPLEQGKKCCYEYKGEFYPSRTYQIHLYPAYDLPK